MRVGVLLAREEALGVSDAREAQRRRTSVDMTAKGAVARSRAARRLPALPPSSHGPPNQGSRSRIMADCGGTTNKALTRAFALVRALNSRAPSAGPEPAHTAQAIQKKACRARVWQ